ncbi:hypothetical protein D6833_01805, partial [Candidatus Parcubacteria bacterium]
QEKWQVGLEGAAVFSLVLAPVTAGESVAVTPVLSWGSTFFAYHRWKDHPSAETADNLKMSAAISTVTSVFPAARIMWLERCGATFPKVMNFIAIKTSVVLGFASALFDLEQSKKNDNGDEGQ